MNEIIEKQIYESGIKMEMSKTPEKDAITINVNDQQYDVLFKGWDHDNWQDNPKLGAQKDLRVRPHSHKPWHEDCTPETTELRKRAFDTWETVKNVYGFKNTELALMGSAARGYAREGSDLEYMIMIDLQELYNKDLSTTNINEYELSKKMENIMDFFNDILEKQEIKAGWSFCIPYSKGQPVNIRTTGMIHPKDIHYHDYFFKDTGYVKRFDYEMSKAS